MPRIHINNNATSTLSVAVSSNTQADLTLQTGHGARFPFPTNADHGYVTLDDGTNVEVCRIVSRSGDVLTVLRGQDGTTAQASFATGTRVEQRLTVDLLEHMTLRFIPRFKYARPHAGVASWQVAGTTIPTDINSRIAGTLTNSSMREQSERIRHTQANSALNPIGSRIAQALISGQPGYRAIQRFGFALAPTSSHFFIGWVNTTGAFASVHPPSSLFSGIVVGYVNSGLNANLSIWRNDASGNAVQLDLGSYFTVKTDAWYEFEIENLGWAATSKAIYYSVRRLDIASIPAASSFFTTDIPDNSLWLSPHIAGCTLQTSGMAVENGGTFWES